MMRAYEEIIEFIAAGTSPGKVIAFRLSEQAKDRVADLTRREKTTGLQPDEAAELGHYLQLEHLMRPAKARAVHHLADDELHSCRTDIKILFHNEDEPQYFLWSSGFIDNR